MKQLVCYRRNADDLRWQIRTFRPLQKFRFRLAAMTRSARLHRIVRKHEKKLLFDYRQSASLTIAPWSPMKRGSNGVCALWSVAEPSQNKKRKARPDKTEGAK